MTVSKNVRHIILYGLILAILVFLLKWLQWRFLIVDNAIDLYVGLIAVFFTSLGIWVATQLAKPETRTVVIEIPRPDRFEIDEAELDRLNLSSREYEILQLLAKGYSNGDIADKLYLSVSTIKTHVSSLFQKMEVKSRTQAIGKAKEMRIIR